MRRWYLAPVLVALLGAMSALGTTAACGAFGAAEAPASDAAASDGGGGASDATPPIDTGPGNGPLPRFWLRADSNVQLAGDRVVAWGDRMGDGELTARAPSPGQQPKRATSEAGAQPALFFDDDDVLTVGSPGSATFRFAPTQDFGVWIVMATTSSGYYHQPIGNESADNRTGFLHVIEGDAGTPGFGVRDQCCPGAFGTTKVNDGRWHDLFGQRSGSDVTLFVDGERQAAFSDPSTNVSIEKARDLFIGKDPNGFFPFAGGIAEVIIYDRALSEEDRVKVRADLASRYGLQ